jgi:hypothetical protein
MPTNLGVYIPILPQKSLTSCPRLVFPTFSDSGFIELIHLNEWMWSYIPLNWARLDPNERCAPSLPTLDGFQWCLHWSCSSEALKMVNPINLDHDIYFLKKPPFFFQCVYTWKLLRWFLSRDLKPPPQDQNARKMAHCPPSLAKPLKTKTTIAKLA